MPDPARNPYLDAPLPALFARTALPVIFVMGMNGLLTVADALFLGRYVGPEALAAATLVFPLYMLIVAQPLAYGEAAFRWASPAAEALLLVLTVAVLTHGAKRRALRWGLVPVEVRP